MDVWVHSNRARSSIDDGVVGTQRPSSSSHTEAKFLNDVCSPWKPTMQRNRLCRPTAAAFSTSVNTTALALTNMYNNRTNMHAKTCMFFSCIVLRRNQKQSTLHKNNVTFLTIWKKMKNLVLVVVVVATRCVALSKWPRRTKEAFTRTSSSELGFV